MKSKSQLVVTGGTGFIGRHFLQSAKGRPVRALTRSCDSHTDRDPAVCWVEGDLTSSAAWRSLLVPGSTVINLAYPAGLSDVQVVEAARVMVWECAAANVARLIHCSTISVYGRTPGGIIDESTPCNPLDGYGRRKLAIENAIRDADSGACEVAILRPAAVFGNGGQNLVSLMKSLSQGNVVVRYLRGSLFGRRKMHLVPVQTVVSALLYLADVPRSVAGQIFNISDDGDPRNNYQEIERILLNALGLAGGRLSVPLMPELALKALLILRGRSELDPYCSYADEKLRHWGYSSPVDFEEELRSFARHWRAEMSLEEHA